MTSKIGVRPPSDPEAGIQYKHRGIYETGRFTGPRILFFATRIVTVFITYSLLVRPSSRWSVFQYFRSAYPATPPPSDVISLPLLPGQMFGSFADSLDMDMAPAVLLGMLVLYSMQFSAYALVWRHEVLPLTGDGGVFPLAIVVVLFDQIVMSFFLYTAGRNPTWSVSVFRWQPIIFVVGLAIQYVSDHVKHIFKESPENKGKVLDKGPWAIVRNPNFAGYHLWRTALGLAAFGWVLGLAYSYMNLVPTLDASVPSIEQHMAKNYGKDWDKYKRKVTYRLVPGLY